MPEENDGLMGLSEGDDELSLDENIPLFRPKKSVRKRWTLARYSNSFRRICILCTFICVAYLAAYVVVDRPKPLPPSDPDEEHAIVYQSNSTDVVVTPDSDNLGVDASSAYQYPSILPNVAWIMSFGGSGTSYTILNTESLTGQSTASNYARDYETLVPVHPEYSSGPYIRSLDKPLPPDFILTKTHCGGYCMDCPPAAYYIPSTDDFLTSCLSGHAHDEFNEMTTTTYSSSIPKRAVHLVRSPFDNVVGRFHLSIKRFRQRGQDVSAYTNDAQGLSAWCEYLDSKHWVASAKVPALEPYLDIPCYAEWYRYIQWHNQATAVTDRLGIPVHYLWYDNYTSAFDATVEGLFDFLYLDAVHEPYEWHAGHSYRDFFPSPQTAIAMMQSLATDTTWSLIHQYAEEYLEGVPEEDDDGSEASNVATGDDDGLVVGNEDNDSGQEPNVAWLLSFPNSVRHMDGSSEHASNMFFIAKGHILHHCQYGVSDRIHYCYQLRQGDLSWGHHCSYSGWSLSAYHGKTGSADVVDQDALFWILQ